MTYRTLLVAVTVLATVMLLAPAPAQAQVGAIALDQNAHRWGWSWNHHSPREADEEALRECGSPGCTVVLRVGPNMCGALATSEVPESTAWGTAERGYREEARDAAVEFCQQHTSGPCTVRVFECNR